MMSRMLPFRIEIHSPSNDKDLIISFESQNPFMAISKGDILNPSGGEGAPKTMLRVKRVEHSVYGEPDVFHVIVVYTEVA